MNSQGYNNNPLSLEVLAEGHCKSIENAKRLIDDAKILYTHKRYIGTVNTLRLAIEEMAKAHLITQAVVFKKDDEKKWRDFWSTFRNHKKKLQLLESSIHGASYKDKAEFDRRIQDLIATREKSVYVHFESSINKFLTPSEIFSNKFSIESTADMELKYTEKLFLFFTLTGLPKKEQMLKVYELEQEANETKESVKPR